MMAARKHGHQPAKRLGWAVLAYHKQKVAAPDPGQCKHCLQNDGKPDERLGVRVGSRNLGSMSERGIEVEQECWFGEGGCLESSEMECVSWRDCC